MIYLLDGPPGSGKSTLAQRLLQGTDLEFCPRVTTRAPRPGDRDYQFVSAEEFARMKASGELAVWRDFDFGVSYGLPRARIDACPRALALIDLGTVAQAQAAFPEAICIFLMAPLDELEARLRARGLNREEEIAERLGNAERAMRLAPQYDYVVVNREGHLERAYRQLEWIVRQPPDPEECRQRSKAPRAAPGG